MSFLPQEACYKPGSYITYFSNANLSGQGQDRLNTFYDNLNAQLEQAGPSSMESDEDTQWEGADVNIDVEMGHNESSSPPDISTDVLDDSAPSPSPQRGRHATVEDVPDEDEAPKLPQDEVWIDNYDEERLAGAIGKPCKTSFQFHCDQQKAAGLEPWSPFETEDEWEGTSTMAGEHQG